MVFTNDFPAFCSIWIVYFIMGAWPDIFKGMTHIMLSVIHYNTKHWGGRKIEKHWKRRCRWCASRSTFDFKRPWFKSIAQSTLRVSESCKVIWFNTSWESVPQALCLTVRIVLCLANTWTFPKTRNAQFQMPQLKLLWTCYDWAFLSQKFHGSTQIRSRTRGVKPCVALKFQSPIRRICSAITLCTKDISVGYMTVFVKHGQIIQKIALIFMLAFLSHPAFFPVFWTLAPHCVAMIYCPCRVVWSSKAVFRWAQWASLRIYNFSATLKRWDFNKWWIRIVYYSGSSVLT